MVKELRLTMLKLQRCDADVDMESKKIEFAYTMGSMALKGYQIDTDNPGWDANASSDEVTELSLTFSF